MPKMKVVGVVKTDKMKKTRRVEIPRLMKYPKYGKFVKARTVCYVHDENEESSVGDTVEIEECRPMIVSDQNDPDANSFEFGRQHRSERAPVH